MDRSNSIFCTIKLIFQSLKMIDSIKKSDDRIHNPDHSASWQDGECDLLIFRSHQSFKKIEHERINLIKRLDLCLWPINLLIAKNYQFDRKTWWLNSQPWCFNVVPCVCNLFIWTNHCSNILSPLISFFKLNIGMKEAKTWPDRKRDFSFTNTSYLIIYPFDIEKTQKERNNKYFHLQATARFPNNIGRRRKITPCILYSTLL